MGNIVTGVRGRDGGVERGAPHGGGGKKKHDGMVKVGK